MMITRFVSNSEAVGEREFKGIAASSDLQQDGYALVISGGDLSRFEGRGGPLLLGHNQGALIGTIWLYPSGDVVTFRAEFLPEGASAEADQACAMLKAGAPFSMSLGFNVLESEPVSRADPYAGRSVTKWVALETSLVSVPMDPRAQITARAQAKLGLLAPRDQWAVDRARCGFTYALGAARESAERRRRRQRAHARSIEQAEIEGAGVSRH